MGWPHSIAASRRRDPEHLLATPFLSVIIPSYNEERRIGPTLQEVLRFLDEQPYTWEVVVVDDGSTDDTAAIASAFARKMEGPVRVMTVAHRGKGWAVKRGMLEAKGRYRFMADADLAMPIDQLIGFLDRMAEGYDIVIGSRQIAGARRYDEPASRHVMGRVFNWVTRNFAVRGFQDTQCGFKCFRGEVADELFTRQKTDGFGFDVEILYVASKRGMRILEMPIDWYHQRSSKVRPVVDTFLMLRDILSIRLRDIRGRY
jgi:dolichyl-phosphate beta-glucosyltransferase